MSDYWYQQRYEDNLFAYHEQHHEGSYGTCERCREVLEDA